eukprot:9611662-Alexandrium_andersonii.AAC.1
MDLWGRLSPKLSKDEGALGLPRNASASHSGTLEPRGGLSLNCESSIAIVSAKVASARSASGAAAA